MKGLVEVLLSILLLLLLLRLLFRTYHLKIAALLGSRTDKFAIRAVSGSVSIGILLLATGMIRGGSWLLTEERHSAFEVPLLTAVVIVLILCATAAVCAYAAWRFARFAVTGAEKTSSNPL